MPPNRRQSRPGSGTPDAGLFTTPPIPPAVVIVDPSGDAVPMFVIDGAGARENLLRLADGLKCDSTGKPVEPKP